MAGPVPQLLQQTPLIRKHSQPHTYNVHPALYQMSADFSDSTVDNFVYDITFDIDFVTYWSYEGIGYGVSYGYSCIRLVLVHLALMDGIVLNGHIYFLNSERVAQ